MGIIVWLAVTACAAVAASALVATARERDWRNPGRYDAPLVLAAAAFALLAVAGAAGPVAGAVLTIIPLAGVAVTAVPAWRALAAKDGKAAATLRVLAGVLRNLRAAAWNLGEDIRGLAGLLRRDRPEAAAAAPAAGRPFTAAPGLALNALRSVPSVLGDPGGVPSAAEVAVDLGAAGAAVPPPWQALADYVGEFEPADQDELEEHMAGDAAGLLVLAEAAGARAEAVLSVRKLHPSIAAALVEIADALTDVAVLYPLAMRRYHDEYGGVEDHHEAGGTLPEDARTWFAGGGAPAA